MRNLELDAYLLMFVLRTIVLQPTVFFFLLQHALLRPSPDLIHSLFPSTTILDIELEANLAFYMQGSRNEISGRVQVYPQLSGGDVPCYGQHPPIAGLYFPLSTMAYPSSTLIPQHLPTGTITEHLTLAPQSIVSTSTVQPMLEQAPRSYCSLPELFRPNQLRAGRNSGSALPEYHNAEYKHREGEALRTFHCDQCALTFKRAGDLKVWTLSLSIKYIDCSAQHSAA